MCLEMTLVAFASVSLARESHMAISVFSGAGNGIFTLCIADDKIIFVNNPKKTRLCQESQSYEEFLIINFKIRN